MQEALKELKISLETLPSHIRDVVVHTSWEAKIKELALKYSLTEEQESLLFTEVLLVLTAVSSEEELAENIENELGVSGILAEQLAEEIGQRIFSWIQRLYTEKEKSLTTEAEKENLDIPPINLPGEVIEESPSSWLPSSKEKSPSILQDQVNSFFAPTPATEPAIEVKPEPISIPQTPITPPVQTPPQPQSFIANKLTQPIKIEPKAPIEIPKTYSVDPYREPIE
jgi:hypothetical protein